MSSISPSPVRSILLLPNHISPTPSHLPLLKSLQNLLNSSYTKTYCAHPDIFGREHRRLASPEQLLDVIGEEGFTIALVRDDEIVATGSAKNFGDGDVDTYAQWSSNLSGPEWAAKTVQREKSEETTKEKVDKAVSKYEVTAFAVSPNAQAGGLGVKILQDVEWLVQGNRLQSARATNAPLVGNLILRSGATDSLIDAVDLDKLKKLEVDVKTKAEQKPKLVLMGIRELGNEAYYQRRGFKSIWSGTVPLEKWDCKKECTMVYMEREI